MIITTVRMIKMTTMIPIITFLFFHHILFLTAREVSLKSYDWSAKVSLFFTKISIFYPLYMILSKFLKASSSASFNTFFSLDNLSIYSLLLYFPIQSDKMGLKSLREWATA